MKTFWMIPLISLAFFPVLQPAAQAKQDLIVEAFRHLEENRLDGAFYTFNRAINSDPKNVEAYFNRGLFFYEQRQYDRALVDFAKTLKIRPNFSTAYLAVGRVYMKQGKIHAAIKEFSKAIELAPYFLTAYYHRGLAYVYSKDFQKSLQDLEFANRWGASINYPLLKYVRKRAQEFLSPVYEFDPAQNKPSLYQPLIGNREAIQRYGF